ncbi:hypothetical protein V5O48_003043 [Marasmius crinis-equi]|uniref:Phytochrome chromophore attachment site domain-containing protein n=1 Tax=Marasmius crinis-equi TaxID=585013 RepID=A0ABR3FTZ8_9AGAR
MSPSSPTESSSSSFVYPIKSLLSGIQPHRRSPGPNATSSSQTPELKRSSTLGLSSPDTKDAGISPASFPGHQVSRSMSSASQFQVRARRSRSVATFASDECSVDDPPSSTTSRKSSDSKSAPNFRHFPAGDDLPTSPRSFAQSGSNSSPASTVASPGEKSESALFSPELFQVDISAPQSPDEYSYDSRHPPPLPLIAGEAFSSTSISLLPRSDPSPPYDRPWELGIVHLPTISSSRASSVNSNPKSSTRSQNSSGHYSNASSGISNYYTPEENANSDGLEALDQLQRSSSPDSTSSISSAPPLATVRFRHHQDENGNHVVTGREGELTACEDEPIRTPGAVQGFGVLIAVQELGDRLFVRQVSENATEILGLSPQYLFSLECFTDTLPDSQAALLWDNIEFLSDPSTSPMASALPEGDDSEQDAPHVFLLSGFGAPSTGRPNETTAAPHDPWGAQSGRRRWTCWVAIHRPQPSPYASEAPERPKKDLIIMEFELEVDPFNPLYPPPGSTFPADSKATSAPSGTTSPGSGGSSSDSASGSGSSSSGTSTEPGDSTDGSSTTLVSVDAASSSDVTSPISDTDISPPSLSHAGSADTVTPGKPASTSLGPLRAQSGAGKRLSSLEGLQGDDEWVPSTEDILESTTSRAKPLLALERLRRLSKMPGPADSKSNSPGYGQTPMKRRFMRRSLLGDGAAANVTGGVGMMDVFAVMAQINDQLGAAPDLDTFLKIVVGLIKDLTQFHRVLVYQFDEMWNGLVVAELVDWSQTHDLYMGLHFPASDIPAQARELYKLNKVRILYDRDQTTARLVVRSKEDLDPPLNMTHCYLRAMSPIHVQCGNLLWLTSVAS